jgi:hypothetical protein
MDEICFYSYSSFVQEERGYHKNWKYAIFKAKYGRWIKTKEREGVVPKAPTKEYLDWLDDYLTTWSKLVTSIQDIQLEIAEQGYLNG